MINDQIAQIISNIQPTDFLEQEHKTETLNWIASGAPIFRIQKPDVPPKHLVSYFVLLDIDARKILLVDHKKAELWLPSGGHVEPNEDPKETVRRECFEELAVVADFLFDEPIFITSTQTVGMTAGHWDISLWYVLKGNSLQTYTYDADEFNSIKWFDLENIPLDRSDPHMQRFIEKLKDLL